MGPVVPYCAACVLGRVASVPDHRLRRFSLHSVAHPRVDTWLLTCWTGSGLLTCL